MHLVPVVAMSSPYEVLGVSRNSAPAEIKRAFKKLAKAHHPDKGGDLTAWSPIQQAYDALISPAQELVSSFFPRISRDRSDPEGQITVTSGSSLGSHFADFESWLRSRGDQAVFTADSVAELYGVHHHTPVALPPLHSLTLQCLRPVPRPTGSSSSSLSASSFRESLHLSTEALPEELEWGEILVSMQMAAMSPSDFYTLLTGGTYGSQAKATPFVVGHEGWGIVTKLGPGVKRAYPDLREGEWVIPLYPFAGTWRSHVVWKAKEVMRVPSHTLPPEYMGVISPLCTAFRLLEDSSGANLGGLQPGDAVILNAANSTVGTILIQLCKLLRLRAIAVIRPELPTTQHTSSSSSPSSSPLSYSFETTKQRLESLGATLVLPDRGSLRLELTKALGSRGGGGGSGGGGGANSSTSTSRGVVNLSASLTWPKVALDAVGGESSARLVECLTEGGELVIYGTASGTSPAITWRKYVFDAIRTRGFNLRAWQADQRNAAKLKQMLETLGKLIDTGDLNVAMTEYALGKEFDQALQHALAPQKNTKILLKCATSPPPPPPPIPTLE